MPWALLQKGTAVNESSSNSSIVFPGACTPGSVLCSAIRLGATGTNPTLSDGTNGAWNRRYYDTYDSSDDAALFQVINTGSSALSATMLSSSTTRRWNVYEFMFSGRLHAYDKVSTLATGTGTAVVSNGITPAENDELLFGAGPVQNGVGSITGANGLTLEDDIVAKIGIGWKAIATPASSTVDFTLNASDTWGAVALLVKASVLLNTPYLLRSAGDKLLRAGDSRILRIL